MVANRRRDSLKDDKLPKTYEVSESVRKVAKVVAIFIPLLGGVVWYLWGEDENFLLFVSTIIIFGISVGLTALLITKGRSLKTLDHSQRQDEGRISGKVCLAMAVVSLVGVFVGRDFYTKFMCAIGVIFFGLGGLYLIKTSKNS